MSAFDEIKLLDYIFEMTEDILQAIDDKDADAQERCQEILFSIKNRLHGFNGNLENLMDSLIKAVQYNFENKELLKSIVNKMNEIVRKLYMSLVRSEETYKNEFIENYYHTDYKKKALIIYILFPFLYPDAPYGHTNQQEAVKMAENLTNRQYTVDIVNTWYRGSIDINQYDIIIGAGGGLEDILSVRNKTSKDTCKIVYYLTMASGYFSNMAEIKRYQYFKERNGFLPEYERQTPYTLNLSALRRADAAICIGNNHTISTYDGMFSKIYPVNVSGFDTCALPRLNKSPQAGINFLWYGGAGAVHKGIDLCIEVFRRLPQLNLYIVGEIPYSIYEFYKNDIENAANLFYYGYLSKDSEEYREVCEQCGYVILPSCSEGQSTAVITAMFSGMIPVCTRETGIDVNRAGGYIIDDISLDGMEKLIRLISELPENIRLEKQKQTYGYVMEHHTLDAYGKRFGDIIDDIIKA